MFKTSWSARGMSISSLLIHEYQTISNNTYSADSSDTLSICSLLKSPRYRYSRYYA